MITHAELMAIPSDPREKSDIERDVLASVHNRTLLEQESDALVITADEWNSRLACCAERLEAYDASFKRVLEIAKEYGVKEEEIVG